MARIGKSGTLVIPAELRKRFGLTPGTRVLLRADEEEIHLYTPQMAIARAQSLVARRVPGSRSLSRELLEDRRGEAP